MGKQEEYNKAQAELLGDIYNEALGKSSDKIIGELKEIVPGDFINQKKQVKKVAEEYYEEETTEDTYNEDFEEDYNQQYDKIPLPSKGLIYGNNFKKSKLEVGYLTASDEDLLSSPNLYSSENQLMNTILRRKILDKNIRPEMLCQGDRDAVLIWLRASSYGKDYQIVTTDEDGEKIDGTVDLSSIKTKEFKLTPNKNGYFEFELPLAKNLIEFRFLVHKDEMDYQKVLEKTNNKLKKQILKDSSEMFTSIISNDNTIEKQLKRKLDEALKSINTFIETIDDGDDLAYTKGVTYRLEKSIISIDGERDRKYIRNYVNSMRAGDSLELRKYINENIPSMDLNVEVAISESAGGGSLNRTFSYDNTLFINY